MTNLLRKLPLTTVIGGDPGRPPREAYCEEVDADDPLVVGAAPQQGPTSTSGYDFNTYDVVPNDDGSVSVVPVVPGDTSLGGSSSGGGGGAALNLGDDDPDVVCYPADPGVLPEPSTLQFDQRQGWNAGAQSIASVTGDAVLRWSTDKHPAGVLVGIAPLSFDHYFGEVTHGLYATDGLIQVVETGLVVATAPSAPDQTQTLRIIRTGTLVQYQVGSWVFSSERPSSGPVHMDATLYVAGDYVDAPSIGEAATLGILRASGGARSSLGNRTTLATAGVPLRASGGARLTGQVYADGNYSLRPRHPGTPWARAGANLNLLQLNIQQQLGTLRASGGARLTSAFINAGGQVAHAAVALPRLVAYGNSIDPTTGVVTETARGACTLPALTVVAKGDILPPTIAYGGGMLFMQAWGYAQVGGTATGGGTLDLLAVATSDDPNNTPVGSARGRNLSLPALVARGAAPLVGSNYVIPHTALFAVDRYRTGIAVLATWNDGLDVADSLEVTVAYEAEWFDMLELQDQFTFSALVEAMVREGIRFEDDLALLQGDFHELQYAFVTETGAATIYTDMSFDQFVQSHFDTFGTRSDGLYLLGQPETTPIRAKVGLGETTLGSTQAKRVSDVFVGVDTDGTTYVRVFADGTDRLYKAVAREQSHRARLGKGVAARRWRLELEIVDTTELALDHIEFIPGMTARRWTR